MDQDLEKLRLQLELKKLEIEQEEKKYKRESRKAMYSALAKAWGEIGLINKDGRVDFDSRKGKVQYSYATVDSLIEAVKPVLSKHGISIQQQVIIGDSQNSKGKIGVKTIMRHADGHEIDCGGEALFSASSDVKELGGLITYARRYTLNLVLSLSTEEDQYEEQYGGGLAPESQGSRQPPRETNHQAQTAQVASITKHPKFSNLEEKVREYGLSEPLNKLVKEKFNFDKWQEAPISGQKFQHIINYVKEESTKKDLQYKELGAKIVKFNLKDKLNEAVKKELDYNSWEDVPERHRPLVYDYLDIEAIDPPPVPVEQNLAEGI